MGGLPSGIVTFLFTDVEGSTALLDRLDTGYGELIDDVRALLRGAVEACGGSEVDCRADELFAAFGRADAAVSAAVAAQASLASHDWPDGERPRVRMGLHTGEPAVRDDGYVGLDVHRANRICAAAHGDQILLSQATRDFLGGDVQTVDLGEHQLRGFTRRERLHQVVAPGLRRDFQPLRTAPDSVFFGDERRLGASAQRAFGVRHRLARTRQLGLAELGWDVRAALMSAPENLREPLAALGGELFTAARSLVDAERYLDQIDHKGLERRLAEYRDLAVISRAAQREVESYERAIWDLEELGRSCARAHERTGELDGALSARAYSAEDVETLRRDVHALSAELDTALVRARSDQAQTALRLRRTRHRGVYRVGDRYVVPYVDSLGIERRRTCETPAQARDFRESLERAAKAQGDFAGQSFTGFDSAGGGSGF
jgi:class 3 adenylate cyclase